MTFGLFKCTTLTSSDSNETGSENIRVVSLRAKEITKITRFNAFPNTPFWNRPKFKEAADDNWNVTIKGFQGTDCIENIVET